MFVVDSDNSNVTIIIPQAFANLGFRETNHLREWIAKSPTVLGEDLLIIQKEFSDFDETRERLDLLALDRAGSLVIIEVKRDDSGKDVTWQALKYVSYCSTFTNDDIVRIFQRYLGEAKCAKSELCEFFGQDDFSTLLNQSQRIILVAANFRKEVTSTVMWLFNRGIDIKCIKLTPYKHGEDIFIYPEQIIPVKDVEEYLVKLARRQQRGSMAKAAKLHADRLLDEKCFEFWGRLQQRVSGRPNSPFSYPIDCRKRSHIWYKSDHHGFRYTFSVKKDLCRIELWTGNEAKKFYKKHANKLRCRKGFIDAQFGARNTRLDWYPVERHKRRHIDYSLLNVNVYDENDWDRMIEFFVEFMPRFEALLQDVLNEVVVDEPKMVNMEGS